MRRTLILRTFHTAKRQGLWEVRQEHPDKLITWQWPTRPLPVSLRIDYIFHSKHFRTQSAKVIDVTGSDHFLVVSDLEWTADPGRGKQSPARSTSGTR